MKWQKVFCSSSCAAACNNKKRKISTSTKEKISKSVGKYYKESRKIKKKCVCEKCGCEFVGKIRKGRRIHCENCKRKVIFVRNTREVVSIFEFSKKTVSKIMGKMKIGCSICGWNKAVCDIHHIIPKSKNGTDCHENLTYVCPNCHREIHNGTKCPTITLKEQIGDSWKNYYGTKSTKNT